MDLNNYFKVDTGRLSVFVLKIRYLYLVALFVDVTVIYFLGWRRWGEGFDPGRRGLALISAVWFASLAPLSWFVIFKAHSYIHLHMNFITWHMPFALLGFGLCGYVAERLVRKILL